MGSFRTAVLGVGLALAQAGADAQLVLPIRPRPDAMMSALTAEVTGTLRQDLAAGRVTDLAQLVETRIVPVFDFPRMTSLALARHWRAASPDQQAALAAEFKILLVRTYSRVLAELRDLPINYKPLRAAAGDREVTVRSAVRRSGVEPLTIDYEMTDGATGWKVYDVKVAGVSLILAYRDSFAATVRAEGIDGLLRALQEKNRQSDASAGPAGPGQLALMLFIYGGALTTKP